MMRERLKRRRNDDALADELAERLRRVLVPREPSAAFVAGLRARLEEMHVQNAWKPGRRQGWRERLPTLSPRFGILLSIVTLVALGVQLVGSVIMIAVLVLGRRRRAAAPA